MAYQVCPEKVRQVLAMMLMNSQYSWYAFVLSQFDIVGSESIPTMALAIDPIKIVPRIIVNPKFAESLTYGELTAVLMHEMWHYLQSYFMRKQLRDDKRWNFAADAVVNWHINSDLKNNIKNNAKEPVKLPDACISIPIDGVNPEDIFSENIYTLIPVNRDKNNQGKSKSKAKQGAGGKSGGGNQQGEKLEESVSDQWNKFEDGKIGLVDDHSLMGTFDDVPDELIKQAIASTIKEATRMAGSCPGGAGKILEELLNSKVPWRTLLRQFVGNHLKVGTLNTWKRPHRRFGRNQPGKATKRSGRIVCVVDTSGSTSQDLPQFFGEVAEIAKGWDTWIIQCDAKVHGKPEQWRRGYKIEAKGFGGTDLNPGLEEARKLKPDCIVVLTDGHLFNKPIDTKRPELWIICQGGAKVAGKHCVQIEEKS